MIELQNVSKQFRVLPGPRLLRDYLSGRVKEPPPFWALRNLSFRMSNCESLGVIGHNGAGKSTLLTLLCGIAQPNEGTVTVEGRVSALLQLGSGFHPDLTGRENVFLNAALLGLGRKQTHAVFNQIVAYAELEDFIDQPLRVYSSGMVLRLAFAIAVQVTPDVLLIDEALAVGDASFQAKCKNTIRDLKQHGSTLVLVSHDLHSIEELCDKVLWLEHGKLILFDDPGKVIPAYRERL